MTTSDTANRTGLRPMRSESLPHRSIANISMIITAAEHHTGEHDRVKNTSKLSVDQ